MRRNVVVAMILIALLDAACGSGLGPAPDPTDSTSAGGTSPSPDRSNGPISVPVVDLDPVVDGLDAPIDLLALPDGDLLVAEQGGRLLRIEVGAEPADASAREVGDLAAAISTGGERGLLGVALHPAWGTASGSGNLEERLFLNYTRAGDGATIVAAVRFDGMRINGTPTTLLEIAQPFSNHNGGDLAFRSDGMLVIPTGDGGSGGDPLGHAQRASSLLGKVLLLDVDDSAAGAEVWLIGVRNPWRIAFDTRDDSLWIADVGQGATEEVTRVPAGAPAGSNLGWNIIEGDRCFGTASCSTPASYLAPIAVYRHDAGACSISGGAHLADASGARWFVVADWCDGLVRGLPTDMQIGDPSTAFVTLGSVGSGISGIVDDGTGRIWALDHAGGRIIRLSLQAAE